MRGLYGWYFCSVLAIAAALATALTVAPAAAAQLGDIPVIDEYAAGMRAVAAMDPDANIRNPDTMASQFLSPGFWFWTWLDEDYDKSKQFIEFYHISAYYTQNACTKHIDGILAAAADNDLPQVVIIGAGLDSRAYRFHRQMPAVRFFEVDLPAVVARKQALVRSATGCLPPSVSYVALDYRNGGMDGLLTQSRYDRRRRTLFIWEGGTRYLDPGAVHRIMRFIADNAAPGSELVFDYISDDIAAGDFSKIPRARYHSVRAAVYGYPWKFGIAPDRSGDFVAGHGFGVISDLGATELARRYLIGSDGRIDGQPTSYVRIMHAVLKP